jgi:acyl-CoA synthetase (NDP forming)
MLADVKGMRLKTGIERKLEEASRAVVAQEEEKSARRSLKGTSGKAISVIPGLQGPTREEYVKMFPYFGSVLNPVDTTAMFSQFMAKDPEYFKKLLRPMVREKRIHSNILMITMSTGERAKKMPRDIVEICRETDKPMVISWIAGSLAEEGYQIIRQARIPLFINTKKSVQAFRTLVRYAEMRTKA